MPAALASTTAICQTILCISLLWATVSVRRAARISAGSWQSMLHYDLVWGMIFSRNEGELPSG